VIPRWTITVAATCVICVGAPDNACAHESRPASLEITESASGALEVVWKRPLQGDVGLRLIPHLSSGELERDPDDAYATADYLIATWRLPAGAGSRLTGNTVTVEGLAGSLTDALVRIRFADGTEQHAVLRGAAPSVTVGRDRASSAGRFRFVTLGMEHILGGPDHLLFVFGLILLVSQRQKLVVTVTGFTLGHTVTLIAASLLRLDLPLPLIDLLIGLSILFLGREILRAQAGDLSFAAARPYVVAFSFGLLHGLGFASGLAGVGLRGAELVSALLQFNVGVEVAQLAFVLIVLATLRMIPFTRVAWPPAALALPSYAVGVAGAVWTLQRAVAVFGS
jgi:hypothetical protein